MYPLSLVPLVQDCLVSCEPFHDQGMPLFWGSLGFACRFCDSYNMLQLLAVQSNIEQHTKTKITQTQDWVNNGKHAIKHRQKSHDHHLICNYAVKSNTVSYAHNH